MTFTEYENLAVASIRRHAADLVKHYAKPCDQKAAALAVLWEALELEAKEQGFNYAFTVGGEDEKEA